MSDETAVLESIDESAHALVTSLERKTGVALSPVERLFLVTDGTITHMLEALTRGGVSVDILDREVQGNELLRTVALRPEAVDRALVWARSTVFLRHLDGAVADELVAGDVGIGTLLREECAETRREIVDLDVRFADAAYPSFVDADPDYLLERTYEIHANGDRIMTITEFFPNDRLTRYRTG